MLLLNLNPISQNLRREQAAHDARERDDEVGRFFRMADSAHPCLLEDRFCAPQTEELPCAPQTEELPILFEQRHSKYCSMTTLELINPAQLSFAELKASGVPSSLLFALRRWRRARRRAVQARDCLILVHRSTRADEAVAFA